VVTYAALKNKNMNKTTTFVKTGQSLRAGLYHIV